MKLTIDLPDEYIQVIAEMGFDPDSYIDVNLIQPIENRLQHKIESAIVESHKDETTQELSDVADKVDIKGTPKEDPIEPDPVEPIDPTDPVDPIEPDPKDEPPVDPVEPTEPVEP